MKSLYRFISLALVTAMMALPSTAMAPDRTCTAYDGDCHTSASYSAGGNYTDWTISCNDGSSFSGRLHGDELAALCGY